MGDAQARGLYPTVIVAYLVGFLLWNYIGPRFQSFHTEPYDCAYLLVLAVMLWRSGHATQIREYFVGRLAPRKSDLPKVALVLSLLAGWWALCIGAGWITGRQPESVDTLVVLDDVVTSPITEEAVYRGVILAVLLAHMQSGRWAALGLSALLFAAIHAPNSVTLLVAITGVGLVLGYAYMATRCVPFCILCHALWNGSLHLAERAQVTVLQPGLVMGNGAEYVAMCVYGSGG